MASSSRVGSGFLAGLRALTTQPGSRPADVEMPKAEYPLPIRPRVNVIPSPEKLQEMIGNALQALKKGIFWDRGSILNLVI